MKVRLFLNIIGLSLVAYGCIKNNDTTVEKDAVQSSYIHKYGIAVTKRDWESRGRDGQVVSTRKDGVVISRTYRAGILDGPTTYTFPHSHTLAKTETYRNGVLVKVVENFASGMPMREEENTASGSKVITCWYESGTSLSVEEYQNGRLVTGKYFNLNGECDSEVVNSKGVRKRRDGYGQLLSCDTIEEGEKILRTTFHPNGAPKELIPYKNGVVYGLKRTFLPGGEPNTIEEWDAGEQHGITTVFRNGEKYAEVPYELGQKKGVERRFRDGEMVQEEVSWVNNQKHGPTKAFVGDIVKTDWYYQGKLVSKVVFDQMSHS